jgi:Gpi18-like mannosyltransferase
VFPDPDKNFYALKKMISCIYHSFKLWSCSSYLVQPHSLKKIGFFGLLAVLAAAEVIIAMYTGNPYDMKVWSQTGAVMSSGANIYIPSNHLGYPPLWALWCVVAFHASNMLGNSVEVWRLIIKLPIILAQFGLAYAVWSFAKTRFDANATKKVLFFSLSWGFIIYIGVLWGQINVISALLTFLAVYAVVTNRIGWGALCLGLAITLKIYPLLALLPLLIYILKNRNFIQAAKFAVYTITLPIAYTLFVFAAYGWNIIYFFNTIFYWSPDSNPLQFKGGCMNIWSFFSLMGVDISKIGFLRLVWIPVLAALGIYWYRKKIMSLADLNLALISFYFLFMITYVWVSEQTFLDTLPFIFLVIFAFKPNRSLFYSLFGIQFLILIFSFFNGGSTIFQPLFEKIYPTIIAPATQLSSTTSWLSWNIRGYLGLIVSISLAIFLLALAEAPFYLQTKEKIDKVFARFDQKR